MINLTIPFEILQPKKGNGSFVCSNPNISAKATDNTLQLLQRAKNTSTEDLEFYIFLYDDPLKFKLYNTWKIQIKFIQPIYLRVQLGIQTTFDVILKGQDHQKFFKINSSHPQQIYSQNTLESLLPSIESKFSFTVQYFSQLDRMK